MRKGISGCIALWVKKCIGKGMRKSISNFNIKVLTDCIMGKFFVKEKNMEKFLKVLLM
jgi:hypothetical protein